jgi:hypothetical protein
VTRRAAFVAGRADLRTDEVADFLVFVTAVRAETGFAGAFRAPAFRAAVRTAAFRAAFPTPGLRVTERLARVAAAFCLDFAAALRRVADFFLAVRVRPPAGALPDRAVLRFRLVVRAPFRFAITRSFRVASNPRLTLTVPGK